jgi:hypothetical protein
MKLLSIIEAIKYSFQHIYVKDKYLIYSFKSIGLLIPANTLSG